MSDDKLPDGVVLSMENITGHNLGYCFFCFFFKEGQKCPKESNKNGGFTLSCANNRDVYFKELG